MQFYLRPDFFKKKKNEMFHLFYITIVCHELNCSTELLTFRKTKFCIFKVLHFYTYQ